jgi:hypothetical protein
MTGQFNLLALWHKAILVLSATTDFLIGILLLALAWFFSDSLQLWAILRLIAWH